MSAVLSEAETKFFSSGGSDVDASLKSAEPPAEPAKPLTAVVDSAPVTSAPTTEPVAPTQQQVPLAALHEERQKRSRAEAERQALQTQLEQLTQQVQQIQKAKEVPPPDPQQDPIGAILYESQQNKTKLAQFEEWKSQQDQVTQQILAQRQFHQTLVNSEQALRAKQPDYDQAFNYASQQYDKMLRAMIPDPAARRQRVIQEATGVAHQLMQEGRDPAQFFYDFAKDMGYTGPQPATTAVTSGAVAAIPQTVPEVVRTIERGLKQQGNPGGGSTPNSEVTPEMALALPAEDFNKWWAKQFRR